MHAIIDSDVQYNLFTDLLDPNVKFSPSLKNDNNVVEHERFVPAYKADYENKFSESFYLLK